MPQSALDSYMLVPLRLGHVGASCHHRADVLHTVALADVTDARIDTDRREADRQLASAAEERSRP